MKEENNTNNLDNSHASYHAEKENSLDNTTTIVNQFCDDFSNNL